MYQDYHAGTHDKKRTDKRIIERLQKFIWKRLHVEECIEKVQRGSAKSIGASILKNGKAASKYNKTSTTIRKTSNASDDETKKSQTNRPETSNSQTSKSSDKTKKTTKTDKTEKTEKTDKDDKTEKDDRTSKNSDDEDKDSNDGTSVVPTSSKSPVKKAVKDYVPKETTISFEDDLFKKEKYIKELDANLFVAYLPEFLDEEEDIIVPHSENTDNSKSKL